MGRAFRRASALGLLAALAAAAPALAQSTGSGPVMGPEQVSVPGCGKSRGTFHGAYSVSHSGSLIFPGAYSASTLNGQFSGPAFVAGNLLDKNFDGRWALGSDPALDGWIGNHVGLIALDLCGTTVVVDSVDVVRHTIKISKLGDRAKVFLDARVIGFRDGVSLTMKYAVRAKGSW